MTALLSGPPLHTPRFDNSIGFFDRVNGGGLISLILKTSIDSRFLAQVLPGFIPGVLSRVYWSVIGPRHMLVADWVSGPSSSF